MLLQATPTTKKDTHSKFPIVSTKKYNTSKNINMTHQKR